MRTGICMIQKALTPESAAVVKQAVTLARRRGHAQVTPLHVASTMLASPTGLLRTSCLSTHSHPLQCKALELCFNVALNRLPAAASSGGILGTPQLSSSHHPPSLSNALVAVFKRSQAHQRRGLVESQQQPILALKIELDQLVISILDDPSVSRVMREAGFSSSHVKSRVEQAVSIKVSPLEPANPKNTPTELPRLSRTKSDEEVSSGDDIGSILESIMGKKRNTVLIGESVTIAESIAITAINAFESKSSTVQFISYPVLSTRNLSREETDRKLSEIRAIISRSSYVGRGIVLYLGDLEGVSEFWLNHVDSRRDYHYFSSLENVVMEIKKWCSGVGETRRVCVLGVATLDSYKKCKFGQPSLENVWELHPLTLPSRNLSLSLNLNSVWKPEVRTDPKRSVPKWTLFGNSGDQSDDHDVQSMSTLRTGSETLPPWLQQYKVEKTHQGNVNIKKHILCKKWNSSSVLKFSSAPCSPTSSSSNFLAAHFTSLKEEVDERPDLLSNPNSSPNSASSSEIMADSEGYSPAFEKRTTKNVKILTNALEAKVPWQKHVIPEIVDTVLSCRSRKLNETTWMAISGPDTIGKEKLARELGKVVFGSHACLVSFSGASLVLQTLAEAVNENPHRVFILEGFDEADEVSKAGITKAIHSGKLSVCDGESVSLCDAIVILTYEQSEDPRPPAKRLRVSNEEEEEEDKAVGSDRDLLDLNVSVDDRSGDDEVELEGDILGMVDGKFIFQIQQV